MKDYAVFEAIERELERQRKSVELIASENFVSLEVMKAQGSIMTNKYAEGYPGRRYYGGCENMDTVENLARERLQELFGAEHANVQPHSGSQANMAVYMTVLQPKDVILGMKLDHGGHLSHGYSLNFSGASYTCYDYGVDKETEQLDYDDVAAIARRVQPKMIVAGASAYSRTIDFEKFAAIARDVGAYLLVDMAHIAGLIAAGLHPNPTPYADFVTSTTHKTMRGPRGGFILCKKHYAKQLDRTVFPGIQGGPLMHVIAAKAVSFYEALDPSFRDYQQQVIHNAQAFAQAFVDNDVHVIGGGTDNHLFLLNIKEHYGITGKEAENRLGEIDITVNKNSIPFDEEKPMVTSGLRLGTPAMTTRGFKETEFQTVAHIIHEALTGDFDVSKREQLRSEVANLLAAFPLYESL